ncbi:hypothetical protein CGRA01v4_15048 [Colletotrichum graminicola]|nr:hypothetical protein CGRA01v4_15048 [Colletotrichum graminicola]
MQPALASAGAIRHTRNLAHELQQHGQLLWDELQQQVLLPAPNTPHYDNLIYSRENWPQGDWVPRDRRGDNWANKTDNVSNMAEFTKAWVAARSLPEFTWTLEQISGRAAQDANNVTPEDQGDELERGNRDPADPESNDLVFPEERTVVENPKLPELTPGAAARNNHASSELNAPPPTSQIHHPTSLMSSSFNSGLRHPRPQRQALRHPATRQREITSLQRHIQRHIQRSLRLFQASARHLSREEIKELAHIVLE